jgi:hypothetical protein
VFEEAPESRIHATLIGLEADVVGGQLFGHWFNQNRSGTRRAIDFSRLLELLRRLARRRPIFTVRFGGFRKAYCTCLGKSAEGWACPTGGGEFHSCDRSAYEGSFYAVAPGPAILTGWPVRRREALHDFPHSLYDFRRAAESAGFLDKYHGDEAPHWMDDDCYIKLGWFRKSLRNLDRVEHKMREYLRGIEPVTVDMTAANVSIVSYRDPSLRRGAIVRRVTLRQAIQDVRKIRRLYQ